MSSQTTTAWAGKMFNALPGASTKYGRKWAISSVLEHSLDKREAGRFKSFHRPPFPRQYKKGFYGAADSSLFAVKSNRRCCDRNKIPFCRAAKEVGRVAVSMIECIFTVDYEIYGNGSGSLQDLVYKPAEKLKELFQAAHVPCVIFVEAAELELISPRGQIQPSGL